MCMAPSDHMSRGIAVCTTVPGSAAAKFCRVVILCSHWLCCIESLCLAKWLCLAVVQEAMAAMKSSPSDKALSISLADRHWLKNLPRKIFSACMKFGGNRCKDVEAHRF